MSELTGATAIIQEISHSLEVDFHDTDSQLASSAAAATTGTGAGTEGDLGQEKGQGTRLYSDLIALTLHREGLSCACLAI